MKTMQELDKIATSVAVEDMNRRNAEDAIAMIDEGLAKLGQLSLINNDIDVTEKIASNEMTEDDVIAIGANAYQLIKEAKADEAWEEVDKEAHDAYHNAFQAGYEDALKEAQAQGFFF